MNLETRYFQSGFQPESLIDVLRWRAENQPNRKVFTFLKDGEVEEGVLTFQELDRQARSVGAALQQMGLEGQRALLLCPPDLNYIVLFLGCLYGRVAPVPAYPPDPNNLPKTLPKVLTILKDALAGTILTTRAILTSAQGLSAVAPDLAKLRWLDVESLKSGHEDAWKNPEIKADDLAYLQYTSGSTLSPRGVMITHGSLLENMVIMGEAFHVEPDETSVMWIPPYHNMGLIAGLMIHVALGMHCVYMSPVAFLQNPYRWVKAMSDYRATRGGAPNFAYDLTALKTTPEQRANLDLNCWKLAFNGAEAVRPDTIQRFMAAFGSTGFRPECLIPAYGLAEATLMVSGGLRQTPPLTARIDRASLENNRLVLAEPGSPSSQVLVGCGKPFSGQEIRIVNPENLLPCPPDGVGEIWVKGGCVASGYWNRPQETEQTFHAYTADTHDGPYMRTGDLGFLYQGELFIAGRLKDLIIIHGKNLYPQDIELTIDRGCKGLAPGSNAAFAVEIDGEERLGIVQEYDPQCGVDSEEMIRAIRKSVTAEFSLPPYVIVLIKKGSIPKTASGKIQRFACRDEYLAGTLDAIKISSLSEKAEQPAPVAAKPAEENIFKQMFLGLPAEIRRKILVDQMGKEISKDLSIPTGELDPDAPLTAFGLDSIEAVELSSRVTAMLGVELPIAALLQGASLNQLADLILDSMFGTKPEAKTQLQATPTAAPIQADKEYPLSYGQRAIWFIKSLEPENVAYNLVYAFRMNPEVDIQVMQTAFRALVQRHPSLRTTFAEKDGEPVQIIHETLEPEMIQVDASGWTKEELRARLSATVYQPFDIQKGPLLRIHFLMNTPEGNVIQVAIYHIVTDLWSMAVFLSELGPLYEEALGHADANLKPLADTYTDYVAWQKEMVEGPEGQKHWDFWKQKLAGDIPALNLPTDRPRPPVSDGKGAAITVRMDSELAKSIQAYSEQRGTSAYITILGAFYVLLHRYTGQTDIRIGFPKFNRDRKTARMMGYFINPVVLRSDLSGDPSFNSYLDQVRQTTLESFEHDAYPFPLIVEKIRPVRERSVSPLFQVIFSWQKTTRAVDSSAISAIALGEEGKPFQYGSMTLSTIALPERGSPSDLALMMAENGSELALTMEYKTELFDQDTIERILANLQALLTGIVNDPEAKISTLPLLSTEERQKLLVEWNGTARMPWRSELLHQLFEAQVDRVPAETALVSEGMSLTYAQLETKANQLANFLVKEGVGPETIVGICAERCPELIVGLLGILKAGGVYLPLDPEYPAERLDYMITDSGLPVLLTQEKFLKNLPATNAKVVCLDKDWPQIAGESSQRPDSTVKQDNSAYIIYTSGTTGKPKGVLIPHGAAANHNADLAIFYGHHTGDRVLQFASPNFDASIEQIFTAFSSGAALYLRDREMWTPAEFSQKIHELGLTVVNIPPAYWHQWVVEDAQNPQPVENPQLRLVIIGGDVLLTETLNLWYRIPASRARLLNAYGPTETTITSAIYEVPLESETGRALWKVPIGRPTVHRAVYILDPLGQPTPIGVPGELHIGGGCLSSGYLNHPDLSAARFVTDNFSDAPQAKMYRTGDLARYLPDGNIEFLGRIDRQVKLRGFRIELEEIESVLQQQEEMAEVAVMLRQDEGPASAQLVGYLVPKPGASIHLDELQKTLQQQLPGYMVPSAFVILENLPLLPSGKINRAALPAPEKTVLEGKGEYAAPTNELEQELACMWGELLHVERVGINDNFFDLGGHSLLATQLVSRVRAAYQIELPLRQLFEAPTVAGLAALIMEQLAKQSGDDELDGLLSELENLSDEEAQKLLKDEESGS